MDFKSFCEIVEEIKTEKPGWFTLAPDRKPSNSEVRYAEDALFVKLPDEYLDFVIKYGGGMFVFTIIYSMDDKSDYYIVDANRRFATIPENFLAFSDNGCGDLYGFKVIDNLCESKVYILDHELNQILDTDYNDILEFILVEGLKISLDELR